MECIFNLELDEPEQSDESDDEYIEKDEQVHNAFDLSPVFDEETDAFDANIEYKVSSRKIGWKDFKCLKSIGYGAFGKVYLVKKITGKDQGNLFAMKILRKDVISQKEKDIRYTKAERNILGAIKHPFIVDLFYAFQTKGNLYLVLEFIRGGDFYLYLVKEKMLLEDSACFYAAEVTLAFEFLHKEGIIYRDLKPENILIDADGHVKLVDFGLCKEEIYDGCITYSFCGTIDYMAPEVISRNGHGKAADWWSLGTLMYTMLTGKAPFCCENKKSLMQLILKQKVSYPKFITEDARDLMQRLMKRPVKKRLGSGPDDAEPIKKHLFFRNVNWDDLLAKKVVPPYKPEFTSEEDVSHFDIECTQQVLPDSTDDSVAGSSSNPFKGFSFEAPGYSEEFLRNSAESPMKCSFDFRGT
ncbi:ribosomal protein S6 kinase beta-1 [Trichonephila clavata]|uniref:Ribosomal protein S6 kinase beta-1 n=1 Tax=Trichonephila clavata TaxID=2740835 RepID=A0A8X6KVP1_TRICU|nr:ribosomal protein S6 kinase beta-1 [Trichonephila clavata]